MVKILCCLKSIHCKADSSEVTNTDELLNFRVRLVDLCNLWWGPSKRLSL